MKKNVLSLVTLATMVSLSAQVGMTVTGSAPVKIKPATLLTSLGDVEIKVGTTAVVSNEGYVYVKDGQLNNNVVTNPENNFILEYTNENNNYGQLITNGATSNAGKVTMNKLVANFGTGASIQTAFPFKNYTIADWWVDAGLSALTLSNYTGCTTNTYCAPVTRAKLPGLVWDNSLISFVPMTASTIFAPSSYYVIRTRTTSPIQVAGVSNYVGQIKAFKAEPNNESVTVAGPNGAINFDSNASGTVTSADVNQFNIPYITYVDDYIDTAPFVGRFGKDQLQLGNPYTSNIDLSYIALNEAGTPNDGNDLDVKGIWIYSTAVVSGGSGPVSGTSTTVVETDGGSGYNEFTSGDVDKLVIRPFTSFVVKGLTSFASQSFSFNDNLKTFKNTSKVSIYGANGPAGTYTVYGTEATSTVNQATLLLNDVNGSLGNRVHTTASPNYISGLGTDTKCNDGVVGFYGLVEDINGGRNQDELTKKIYINKINTDFIGKSIPLGFKAFANHSGDFTITSFLTSGGRILGVEEKVFADPSVKFFFHDKKTGVMKEITTDFSYSFNQTTDTEERFELFYGSYEVLNTENIAVSVNKTSVYKSNASYYVRFAKDWKKADVSLYTIAGQLISNAKGLDAAQDYLIPTTAVASGYVVKIQNTDTNEIVTSKIVK